MNTRVPISSTHVKVGGHSLQHVILVLGRRHGVPRPRWLPTLVHMRDPGSVNKVKSNWKHMMLMSDLRKHMLPCVFTCTRTSIHVCTTHTYKPGSVVHTYNQDSEAGDFLAVRVLNKWTCDILLWVSKSRLSVTSLNCGGTFLKTSIRGNWWHQFYLPFLSLTFQKHGQGQSFLLFIVLLHALTSVHYVNASWPQKLLGLVSPETGITDR